MGSARMKGMVFKRRVKNFAKAAPKPRRAAIIDSPAMVATKLANRWTLSITKFVVKFVILCVVSLSTSTPSSLTRFIARRRIIVLDVRCETVAAVDAREKDASWASPATPSPARSRGVILVSNKNNERSKRIQTHRGEGGIVVLRVSKLFANTLTGGRKVGECAGEPQSFSPMFSA